MAQKKSNTTQSTLPKKVGMLVYYNHELRQDIEKEVIIYKKLDYGSLCRWFMYQIDNDIDYFDFNYSIFTGGSTIRYNPDTMEDVYIIDPDTKLVYHYNADSYTTHIIGETVDLNYTLHNKYSLTAEEIKDLSKDELCLSIETIESKFI